MSHGTVRNPLTEGEIFELGATVMQQLGRGIDPDKARYYIRHKSQLGKDFRKLGLSSMPEFDSAEWERFYLKHFSHTIDLAGLHVPPKPDYLCRAVVIIPGITNNIVFDACTKAFKTWRYTNDLNTVTDVVQRPSGPYVVWVRDVVEADEDMKNKSAEDIEKAGINTMTLNERMVLELKYFDETGKHLDIENWTLCAGSRGSDGGVPCCYWGFGKFYVIAYGADLLVLPLAGSRDSFLTLVTLLLFTFSWLGALAPSHFLFGIFIIRLIQSVPVLSE